MPDTIREVLDSIAATAPDCGSGGRPFEPGRRYQEFVEWLQMITFTVPDIRSGLGDDPLRPSVNIAEALRQYSEHTKTLARGWERQAQLERLLSRFRDRSVRSLRQAELVEALESWGGPTMNRYRAALSHFLKFCRQREWTTLRPELPRARERSRDHVLTLEELRVLYESAASLNGWRGFARLLLLTGQRRGEVVDIRPSDVRDGWWNLAATKNGQPHAVWLPAVARAELVDIGDDRTPWTGRSGFSDLMTRWRRVSGIEGWRMHDARRSFASHLIESGESELVVDRILNHQSGGPSSVSRVYNRARLLPARKAAAEQWARMLLSGS